MMTAAKKSFIECATVTADDGTRRWIHDGQVVFVVDPHGTKTDLRTGPPFLPMSPCPYCGVENDRNHDALQHVDPRFGVPVA